MTEQDLSGAFNDGWEPPKRGFVYWLAVVALGVATLVIFIPATALAFAIEKIKR